MPLGAPQGCPADPLEKRVSRRGAPLPRPAGAPQTQGRGSDERCRLAAAPHTFERLCRAVGAATGHKHGAGALLISPCSPRDAYHEARGLWARDIGGGGGGEKGAAPSRVARGWPRQPTHLLAAGAHETG